MWESGGSRVQQDWVANVGPSVRALRLTQKAGWSGSACLSVSETVVASAPTCPMAILFPSVECPVSPGGDMVRTSMIHAVWQRFIWAVGSGRARKSIETAWAVRLDVGVSASGVDSQRDSTA